MLLDLQEAINLRDERHHFISVLLVRSKLAKLHPFLWFVFLFGNHRALLIGRTVEHAVARSVPKARLRISLSYLLERSVTKWPAARRRSGSVWLTRRSGRDFPNAFPV